MLIMLNIIYYEIGFILQILPKKSKTFITGGVLNSKWFKNFSILFYSHISRFSFQY